MKIYFESYGCTLNSGEALSMKRLALDEGHSLSDSAENADLAVLVTCTVIEPTELKMVRRMKELARHSGNLVVAGCMASVQAEKIKTLVPAAVVIPTPGQVDGFSKYLRKLKPGVQKKGAGPAGLHTGTVNDVSAPVPIAEGCLGSCSYCITRFARGALRSYTVDDILENIRIALAGGAREIRLTAQDSATFGFDSVNSAKLPKLLDKIGRLKETTGIEFKVRVGMMNPNSVLPIMDDLIAAYQKPYIFKFLHLPVQSGSDRILELMGRNYNVEQFKSIVRRFRKTIPGLMLSTDVIIGFPGETETDHRMTVELIEAVKPNIVNLTRFSARPGTPAERLGGKLHGRVQKARSRELTDLCRKVSLDQNRKLIGSVMKVLATERNINQYTNTTLARSSEYRPVVIGTGLELGTEHEITVKSVTENYLIGEIN